MRYATLAGAVLVAGIALAGAPGVKAPAKAKTPASKAASRRKVGDGGTPLEFGTLELNVKGTVTVSLDGRELGQTPLGPVKVLAGKHQLRLVNRELGIDQTQELEILPGHRSTLEIGFE